MTGARAAVFAGYAALALSTLTAASAEAEVSFRFPGADEHREHFYITAYRDVNGPGGGVQDWGCGTLAYDGHRGTDIGGGSFAGMDEGRDIVAAAPGVVTAVHDGAFDRCTTGDCPGGGGFGNYVRLRHADGTETYYAHLKRYSLTVAVGDEVSCGQKLGEMGSSGSSTGPHLHFEPRISGVSHDPYAGPCSGQASWWVDQGEHGGLPAATCQESPDTTPKLSMAAESERFGHDNDREAGDAVAADVGEIFEARFFVRAGDEGGAARDVVAGIDAPADLVTVLDWEIYDDFHANACGGEMCPNDANDHPDNPPRELPGERFDLHLYALSPGETKMIVLTVRADAQTSGDPARLGAWIKHIPGVYEKSDFSAEPVDESGSQSWNDGDLKRAVSVDIADGGGGAGGDPGENTGDDDDPPAGASSGSELTGGCAAGPGAASPIAPLFALWVLSRRRRRDARR